MAQAVTDADFKTEIAEGTTLVDFWADWCGPCKMIAPIVEELAEEYKGKVKVVKLDTDANQSTPQDYQVQGIPTLILFKDGEVVERLTGAYPKAAIVEMLEKHV